MLYHGNTSALDLKTGGEDIQFLANAGQIIYARAHSTRLNVPLRYRTVTTSTDKWFEVGIPVLASIALAGNSSAGWTLLNGFFGLHLEWSQNLTQWAVGKFTDSGTPEAVTLDGEACLIYWARSIYSLATKTKTGFLWLESTVMNGNVLNGPFTALTINSIARALGGFTYSMPADAARLQADLRTVGFTGAIVTAVSATLWRIDLPNLSFTDYGKINKIYWPGYVVTSEMGSSTVDGWIFNANYFNSSGVICELPMQYARLGSTCLKL